MFFTIIVITIIVVIIIMLLFFGGVGKVYIFVYSFVRQKIRWEKGYKR